jgi:phosphoribosyl 1,2-cyclic phosphodiesterase
LRFKGPNRLIIIDAGTGIRELGNYMMTNDHSKGSIKTDIFLTHTHWDHIQGFPFFTPIYIPGTKLKVYGPITYEDDSIGDVLGEQWSYRYFPVRQEELAAEIEYIDLGESRLDLGDGIMLTTKYLNHPVLCLGYRFEYRGKVFCTAYDTEPFHNVFYTSPADPAYDEYMVREGEQVARAENRRIENFFSGADFLIHDTQYTHKEYKSSRVGWGHSSYEYAIAAAKRAGVKRLALFHHDPMRTDAQIEEATEKYCNPDISGDTSVFFAREGMEIDL